MSRNPLKPIERPGVRFKEPQLYPQLNYQSKYLGLQFHPAILHWNPHAALFAFQACVYMQIQQFFKCDELVMSGAIGFLC